MFGCVIAGRLLQTNMQQIDETHAIFELPLASTINHLCVFLLGTVPFPDGYGATVHFHWPGKGFQLLGMLSNEKPSAIFRLRGTFTSQTSINHSAFHSPDDPTMDPSVSNDVTAVLGISVEPLPSILSQMPNGSGSLVASGSTNNSDPTILAEKIIRHLFTYLSSFTNGFGTSLTPDSIIPLGMVSRWYESFLAKVRIGGIGFLDREE